MSDNPTEMPAQLDTNVTLEADEYAEPEVSTVEELWTWVVLYSVCIIFTLVINTIVIIGLTKRKDGFKENQLDVYLMSLIVSRMFIAAFVVPARITGLFSEEYLGSLLCKLCHYIGVASVTTSIFSTTTIALLKYYDIVISKRRHIFKDTPFVGVAIIWIFGYIYASRVPFVYDLAIVETTDSLTGADLWLCTVSPDMMDVGMKFAYIDLMVLFVVPVCIIIFCYGRVVSKLAKLTTDAKATGREEPSKTMQVNNLMTDLSSGSVTKHDYPNSPIDPTHVQPKGTQRKDLSKEQQKVVMSVVVWLAVLFFVCCSLPYGYKLYFFWSGKPMTGSGTLETTLYFISYSNAWMNAIVLLRYRADIRRAAIRFICTDRKIQVAEKQAIEERGTSGLG